MRAGLKKPDKKIGQSINRFAHHIDIKRELRAKGAHQHPNVKRFGIPARAAAAVPASLTGELIQKSRPKLQAAGPPQPLPSMVTSVSHQKLERMLDQALTHADTHKEAMRYHAARQFWHRRWFGGRRRWLGGFLVLVVIAAGIWFAWQNVPQLSIKAAGARAHLAAAVPSYLPEGYKMTPAKAISGTVAIDYASTGNSKSYEIVQAQSDLTSSLVSKNVVPKDAPVQTSQVDGNTVYIYGDGNNAAWVNNGILYTIKDKAGLTSDELIKIVKGINP